MRDVSFAVVLLALGAVPATAAAAPGGAAPAEAEQEPQVAPAERMICKRQQIVGSRVNAKRVCATAEEWARMEQENRQEIDKIQAARYKNN